MNRIKGYLLEEDGNILNMNYKYPSMLRKRVRVGKPSFLNKSNIYFTGGELEGSKIPILMHLLYERRLILFLVNKIGT